MFQWFFAIDCDLLNAASIVVALIALVYVCVASIVAASIILREISLIIVKSVK